MIFVSHTKGLGFEPRWNYVFELFDSQPIRNGSFSLAKCLAWCTNSLYNIVKVESKMPAQCSPVDDDTHARL